MQKEAADYTVEDWKSIFSILAVCSHRRAYYYLAEAIKRPSGFSSVPCKDWYTFEGESCKNQTFTLTMWNEYDNRYGRKYKVIQLK